MQALLYLSKPYSTYQRVCQNSETLVIFLKQEKKNPINKSLYEHEKKALSTHERENTGLGNSSNCDLDDLCKLVGLEN